MSLEELKNQWLVYLDTPHDITANQNILEAKLLELRKFLGLLCVCERSVEWLNFRDDVTLCHVGDILVSEFEEDLTSISRESDENDLSKLHDYLSHGRGSIVLQLLSSTGISELTNRQRLGDIVIWALKLCLQFTVQSSTTDCVIRPVEVRAFFTGLLSDLKQTGKHMSRTGPAVRNTFDASRHRLSTASSTGASTVSVASLPASSIVSVHPAQHARVRRWKRTSHIPASDSDDDLAANAVLLTATNARNRQDIPPLVYNLRQQQFVPGELNADELSPVEILILLLTLLKHVVNEDIKCAKDTTVCTLLVPHIRTFFGSVVRQLSAQNLEATTAACLNTSELLIVARCTLRLFFLMLLRVCELSNGLTWLRRSTIVDDALGIVNVNTETLETIPGGKLFLLDMSIAAWVYVEGLLLRHHSNMVVIGTACKATESVTRRRGAELTESVLLKLTDNINCQSSLHVVDPWCFVDLTKSVVAVSRLFKLMRARYMHWCTCARHSHRHCNVTGRTGIYRHHHDALGLSCDAVLPEKPGRSEAFDLDERFRVCRAQPDICMVGNLLLMLLGVFRHTSLHVVQQYLLDVFSRGVAVCCCVPPEVLIATFCRGQPPSLSGSTWKKSIRILVDILMSDCGGSASLDHCELCGEAEQKSVDGASGGIVSSDSALSGCESSSVLVSRWRCIMRLVCLACSRDASFAVHVVAQLAHVAADASKSLCHELYGGFFVPLLLTAAQQLNIHAVSTAPVFPNIMLPAGSVAPVAQLCLSALSVILNQPSSLMAFVNIGGVELATSLARIDSTRRSALVVLEVIVMLNETEDSNMETVKDCLTPEMQRKSPCSQQVTEHPSPMTSTQDQSPDINAKQHHFTSALEAIISLLFADWENHEWDENLFDRLRSDKGLLSNTCDLWHIACRLFASSSAFREQFVERNGPALAHLLLQNAAGTFLHLDFGPATMDVRVAVFYGRNEQRYTTERSWLMLMRSTLSICLRCTMVGVHFKSEETFIDSLLADLMTNINSDSSAGALQLFCEMLLLFVRETNSTECQILDDDYVLSGSLFTEESMSDQEASVASFAQRTSSCEPDESKEPTGYDADRELSSDDNKDCEATFYSFSQRSFHVDKVNGVIHPQLCKLVLQLTAAYQQATVGHTDMSAVTNILFWLVSLAQKSYPTASCMCRQGLSQIFLSEFRTFLASSDESVRVIQHLLLELFLLISQHGALSADLKLLLQLFDVEHAPTDLLLSALISLTMNLPLQPTYSLCMPVIHSSANNTDVIVSYWSPMSEHVDASVRDFVVVNGNSDGGAMSLTKTIRCSGDTAVRNLMAPLKIAENSAASTDRGAIMLSPAKCAPLEMSLRDVAMWPSHAFLAFSLSLWLLVETETETEPSSKLLSHHLSSTSVAEHEISADGSRSFLSQNGKTSAAKSSRRLRWSDMCLHVVAVGNMELMLELWLDSSASHFIARLVTHSTGSAVILCQACIPSRLTRGRWHHVAFTYKESSKVAAADSVDAELLTFVDGSSQVSTSIDYRHHSRQTSVSSVTNIKQPDSCLYVGHSRAVNSQRSQCSPNCQLGNLLLFNDVELNRASSLYLFSLGPDCCTLAECDSSDQVFTYTHHISRALSKTPDLIRDLLAGNKPAFLDKLRANAVLTYSPQHPNIFNVLKTNVSSSPNSAVILSPSSANLNRLSSIGSQSPTVVVASQLVAVPVAVGNLLRPVVNNGTLASLQQLGGIKTFLFLFAKIVEYEKYELEQAKALRIVFNLIHRDLRLAREFINCDGYSMVTKVCMTTRCIVGYDMLRVLMNAAVTAPIIHFNDSQQTFSIVADNTSVICDVDIVFKVILAWHVWERAKNDVWLMAFEALHSLVRSDHPHQSYNLEQLQNAGIISRLLAICKERLQEARPSLPMCLYNSMLGLIRVVIGQHMTMDSIVQICDFLLLIHPAANTYVFQNKTSFCFRNKWIESSVSSGNTSSVASFSQENVFLFSTSDSGQSPGERGLSEEWHNSTEVRIKGRLFPATEDAVHDRGLLSSACSVDTASEDRETPVTEMHEDVEQHVNTIDIVRSSASDDDARNMSASLGSNNPFHAHSKSESTNMSPADNRQESNVSSLNDNCITLSTCDGTRVVVIDIDGAVLVNKEELSINIIRTDPDAEVPFVPTAVCGSHASKHLLGETVYCRLAAEGDMTHHCRLNRTVDMPADLHSDIAQTGVLVDNDIPAGIPETVRVGTPEVHAYIPANAPDELSDTTSNAAAAAAAAASAAAAAVKQSQKDEMVASGSHPNRIEMLDVSLMKSTMKNATEAADNGLVFISTGLLQLLSELLALLPASDRDRLFKMVLRPDMLVVMANHSSIVVRVAIIQFFDQYWQLLNAAQKAKFLEQNGFHLLANQFHQYSVNKQLLDVCVKLLVKSPADPDVLLFADSVACTEMVINEPLYALLLMSLTERTADDPTLCHCALSYLSKVFTCSHEVMRILLHSGLMEMLCNVVHRLNWMTSGFRGDDGSDSWRRLVNNTELQLVMDDIQKLFCTIAKTTFCSSGETWFLLFEHTFLLLQSLEAREADLYGKDSEAITFIASIQCHFLHTILQYFDEQINEFITSTSSRSSLTDSAVGLLSRVSGYFSVLHLPSTSGDVTTAPLVQLRDKCRHRFSLPTISSGSMQINEQESTVNSTSLYSRLLSGINNIIPSHPSPEPVIDENAVLMEFSSFSERAGSFVSRLSSSISWFGRREEQKVDDKSLSPSEVPDRFKKIIVTAVNYILFCLSDDHQQKLMKSPDIEDSVDDNVNIILSDRHFAELLMEFLLKALVVCIQSGTTRKGSLIAAVLWIAKDTLREQFSRLIVHLMSPQTSLSRKLFVLDLLMSEPAISDILQKTINVKQMGQKLAGYCYDLVIENIEVLSKSHRNAASDLIGLLQQCGMAVVNVGTRVTADDKDAMIHDRNVWKSKFGDDRMKWLHNHGVLLQRVLHRLDGLLEKVSIEAMEMTQFVSSAQNMLRRKFVNDLKQQMSDALQVKKAWQQTIQQLTHERAVWYNADCNPPSWQLDPTEGPSRMRRRLQRCHLDMKPEFLLPEQQHKLNAIGKELPLSYLFVDDVNVSGSDCSVLIYKLHTSDSIDYVLTCSNVTPQITTTGSLLIGQTDVFFVADHAVNESCFLQQQALLGNCDTLFVTLPHEQIKEFHKQWYLLNDNAIEIFLTTGKTCLFAFNSTKERDDLFNILSALELPNLVPADDLSAIQELWLAGKMTNFDYLMQLNKMAGRSFNDLMQYPIFPFVLSQYGQSILDLSDPSSYRNLSKTISTQLKEMEQKYQNIYRQLYLDQQYSSDADDDVMSAPYHYSNHCSNICTVLQFLVRLPPFTQLFIVFQDNHFDVPDRTFHSIHRAYNLVTVQSTTDTKELIPEFFYLPEFLENNEGFDFGVMQNGDRVDAVKLPHWCHGDARLFTLIHRQALETDHVRQMLPSWIDLVFGYKQRGKAAIDAINVFHPSSYYGVEVDNIADSLKRNAVKTMIRTTGQTPKQLFRLPHPVPTAHSSSAIKPAEKITAVQQVAGLRWGDYVGSPDCPNPVITWSHDLKTSDVQLVALPTGEVFGLHKDSNLLVRETGAGTLVNVNIEWAAIISWNHVDSIVRMKNRRDQPPVNFLHWTAAEQITCCVASTDCRRLFFGCDSGVITAFHTKYNPQKEVHLQVFDRRLNLFAHTDAVTCLQLCKPFSVLLSAGRDGLCVIWDLNRLSYVRSMSDHDGQAIVSMHVSSTSGDIVSASHRGSGSCLVLHTVNGQLVARVECSDLIRCLAFSPAAEGRSVNVIAAGMNSGKIRLWSSWTLTSVKELVSSIINSPIISLVYTSDGRNLFCATGEGIVHVWEKPTASRRKLSKFMSYVETTKLTE